MIKIAEKTVDSQSNRTLNVVGARALIFDLEGVILNSEPIWDLAQAEVLRQYGISYDPQEVKAQLVGKTGAESIRYLVEHYRLQEDPEVLLRLRNIRVGELLEKQATFIRGFMNFFNIVQQQFYCCILTSMAKSLFNIADAPLSIRKLFEGKIMLVEDLGLSSKSDPSVFELCAKLIQVPPSDCIVIEDSPAAITGANGAGMLTVGLTTTFQRPLLLHAHFVADTFDEVLGFLLETASGPQM